MVRLFLSFFCRLVYRSRCCCDYWLMEDKYCKLNKVHASFISGYVIPSFFLSASCYPAILLLKQNKNDKDWDWAYLLSLPLSLWEGLLQAL